MSSRSVKKAQLVDKWLIQSQSKQIKPVIWSAVVRSVSAGLMGKYFECALRVLRPGGRNILLEQQVPTCSGSFCGAGGRDIVLF